MLTISDLLIATSSTKHKEFQTGFVNMTKSPMFFENLSSQHLNPTRCRRTRDTQHESVDKKSAGTEWHNHFTEDQKLKEIYFLNPLESMPGRNGGG